jgi:hypothetical protein
VRDADVETLKGEGVEQRSERRHQHFEPPHSAGVAPSPGMSCDRHKFSTSNVGETQPHSERTPMILPPGDGLDGTIVFIEPPSQKFSTNACD